MPFISTARKLSGSARSEAGFERGAMNAHEVVDLADGIFENVHDIGSPSGGSGSAMATSIRRDSMGAFSSKGPIGKEFNPDGKAGGTAQKMGGPFDKEGAIGKQFTKEGSIGGKVDDMSDMGRRR